MLFKYFPVCLDQIYNLTNSELGLNILRIWEWVFGSQYNHENIYMYETKASSLFRVVYGYVGLYRPV